MIYNKDLADAAHTQQPHSSHQQRPGPSAQCSPSPAQLSCLNQLCTLKPHNTMPSLAHLLIICESSVADV